MTSGLMGNAALGPFEGYPAQSQRSGQVLQRIGEPDGIRNRNYSADNGAPFPEGPRPRPSRFRAEPVVDGAPGLESNCRPLDYKTSALPLSYRGKMLPGFSGAPATYWEVW